MQKHHSQTLRLDSRKPLSSVVDNYLHKSCCRQGQGIELKQILRGGQDEQTPDVQERIEKEKKISKKRRLEKKKWKKFDEEKKVEAEVEKQKIQIITGADGMIYALDPDFPDDVNFVPKPMPEEAVMDTKVYNETQMQEMDEKAARDEADQFLSFTRKPLADAELEKDLLDLVTECEKVRQIKKGANEVTKAINRNTAEFIIIAADTVPIEIVLHLPLLCEDKGVPFVWVSTRTELSKALNMHRPVTSTAILSNERSHLAGRIRKLRAQVDSLPY
jgi:U4/U6 small nuclear ribonucleoprotein SNU13